MEYLTQIFVWIGSIFGGISIAGIVSAIVYGVLRGSFKKALAKVNVKDICKTTIDETLKGMKTITYTYNIQPTLNSELEKINEKANEYLNEKTAQIESRYDKLIKVMEKLSAYFDNSIGVSEQAKAELKQAIADAKLEEEPEIKQDEMTFVVEEQEISQETQPQVVEIER